MTTRNCPSVENDGRELCVFFDALDVLAESFILIRNVFELEHVFDAFDQLDSVDGFGQEIVGSGVNSAFTPPTKA